MTPSMHNNMKPGSNVLNSGGKSPSSVTINGASVAYTYFSNSIYLNEYKCYSKDTTDPGCDSYVLRKLWSYTGGVLIDNVGSGPSLYTTDDCTTDSQAWTAIGST